MSNIKCALINKTIFYAPNSFLQLRHYFNNRKSVTHWLDDDPFLLHIPKTAGTSIARSLNRVEPGHFKYEHLVKLYPRLAAKKQFYFVSRNPVDRMVSTYNYINSLHERFGTSNIPAAYYAKSFDHFVVEYLANINVNDHYFLRPVQSFISGIPRQKLTAICFDDLSKNLNKFYKDNGYPEIDLLHENKSEKITEAHLISEEARKVIAEMYSFDFSIYQKAFEEKVFNLELIGQKL